MASNPHSSLYKDIYQMATFTERETDPAFRLLGLDTPFYLFRSWGQEEIQLGDPELNKDTYEVLK